MAIVYVVLYHRFNARRHIVMPLEEHEVNVLSIHWTLKAANRAVTKAMELEESVEEDETGDAGWIRYEDGRLDVMRSEDRAHATRLWVMEEIVEDENEGVHDVDSGEDSNVYGGPPPPAKRQKNT